jgi:iron complex outermembrane recepter protein
MPQGVRRSAGGCESARAAVRGLALAVLLAGTPPARAQDVLAMRLADLSLEQLSEVVVSTASRLSERLDRVAAAAYVISAEDIRRSGATSLPEALRLAPMLTVSQADANQYAISARGLNNVLANKMLVLIDGRAVYSPLFSGVFWEAQELLLEDVDRIEIITGPSTALWGSNAVLGLIHVITRSARETQGPLVSANAGRHERSAGLRYGGGAGSEWGWRLYARSFDRDSLRRADGSSIDDSAHGVHGGLRWDWSSGRDSFRLLADGYRNTIDQPLGQRRLAGASIVGHWQRVGPEGDTSEVQVYLDHSERHQQPTITEKLDTLDLVAQHSFRAGQRHLLVLGGGARRARDEVRTGPALAFVPSSRNLEWLRLFAQDQIDLTPELTLTLAASVERNPYTGTELLPSLRLAWRANPTLMWWGSLSHAVRAPSRIDVELVQPGQPPYSFIGNRSFRSELADVLELGLRAQPDPALSYAVTLFRHEYRRLRSLQPTAQGVQFGNGFEGTTQGAEMWARWRVGPRWRLDAGLTLLDTDLRLRPGALDIGGAALLGNDPRRVAKLRSSVDLVPAWSWDLTLRRFGALPEPAVPAYTALDTRLAWRLSPAAELALVLRNITDARHAEWGAAPNRAEIERSAALQLRWQP